jgi:hypothetical protein
MQEAHPGAYFENSRFEDLALRIALRLVLRGTLRDGLLVRQFCASHIAGITVV